MATKTKNLQETEAVMIILPPKIEEIIFKIKGTSPLMTHRFSQKMNILNEQMSSEKKSRKKTHEPKDPEKLLNDGTYIHKDGWYGMPASAFRSALISACRVANYKMTLAKLSLFVVADGVDKFDHVPIIKIEGKRERSDMTVRIQNTMDVRIRPIWTNWKMKVHIKFDATQFSHIDVYNLFMRAGMQVGIGEGRPDSKTSGGLGYGTFEIMNEGEA